MLALRRGLGALDAPIVAQLPAAPGGQTGSRGRRLSAGTKPCPGGTGNCFHGGRWPAGDTHPLVDVRLSSPCRARRVRKVARHASFPSRRSAWCFSAVYGNELLGSRTDLALQHHQEPAVGTHIVDHGRLNAFFHRERGNGPFFVLRIRRRKVEGEVTSLPPFFDAAPIPSRLVRL